LPLVIFVTAHDEHAIRAFELHALDYLVKPYREDRLREAIGRRSGACGPASSRSIPPAVGAWVASQPAYPTRIRIEDKDRIRFIRVKRHPVDRGAGLLRAAAPGGERILRRGTLKQFLRTLDPARLVRVHSIGCRQRAAREGADDHGERRSDGAPGVRRGGRRTRGAFRAELEERLRTLP
jgi:hypothetical protein